MITPTTWLQESITNPVTTNAQADPRVVALANGNFLVVWEDDNDVVANGTGTDIVGVIFNALGQPITGSLFLNNFFGFSRQEVLNSVAATPDGGFVMVYTFANADDTDLIFGIYDAAGTRTGQDFAVSDSAGNGFTYSNPSVAVQSDGSFFVTYERDDGTNQDLAGRKFTATGTQVGGEVVLREDGFAVINDNENIAEPRTVALNNGGFATVYVESDTFGGVAERTIELRLSNANGSNGVLINGISVPDGADDSGPRIVQLADNRLLIAWVESGDIRGRILNEDGTSSVPEFIITNNASLNFSTMELVALEDGGYYTVFRDDTVGRLLGVRGNNGGQVGVTIIISNDADGAGGNIGDFSASLTTDGRILVSWENGEIYTEILDPRELNTPINADPGDGQITDRLATSNTINGAATDDIIYGLDGNDTLFGNDGDDTLDGGTGDDTLVGGLGDDTYLIDSAGDVAAEFAGEGFDRIISSLNFFASAALYSHFEAFELAGTATELRGNQQANELVANAALGSVLTGLGGGDLLVGGAGDDFLNGGLGNDVMRGGAGDDTYFVFEAGDLVAELEGEGIDIVRSAVNYALGLHVEDLRLAGAAATVGTGNSLANRIFGGSAGATLSGLGGDDTISGSNTADIIDGGNGADRLLGNGGEDTIHGGEGDDIINGGTNIDTLHGDGGNDLILGGIGNDILFGGAGSDTLRGEANSDTLHGEDGADILDGGDGVDLLIGGANRDVMTGGLRADVFAFDDGDFAGLAANTADRITDFSRAEGDKIDLSAVDAILGGADDAFDYIGSDAFSGTAGELRWEHVGSNTMIFMDVDGDALADYAIRLDGTINLAETSFIL
ncbi:MAG: hypothetical protein JY451_10355 [Erythrobacter sp.]|nr:MAG: hypothetical protein JY451_10355 [Erythrobacter sp.]